MKGLFWRFNITNGGDSGERVDNLLTRFLSKDSCGTLTLKDKAFPAKGFHHACCEVRSGWACEVVDWTK